MTDPQEERPATPSSTAPPGPAAPQAASAGGAGPEEHPAPDDGTEAARTVDPAKLEAEPFAVTAIGASAGGLEAITALISRITFDGMGFVVIQHLAPSHESMLPAILRRSTRMEVCSIEDGMEVRKNRIHVAPEGKDVTLVHGVFHTTASSATGPRHPIDSFFRSLAEDQHQSAIGVVLSGTGSDGALGLRAIKAEGGLALVQDSRTAKYPGMPEAALNAGAADFTGSAEAIADELMTISMHPYLARRPAALEAHPDDLARVFGILNVSFGNDLNHYKRGTLVRRIERRMALLNCLRLTDYVKLLESSPAEPGLLYKDMLINVTSFFRDREPFEALKTLVLPRILAGKRRHDAIRVWSTGCSTGEEPFSIVMCLLEALGERAADYRIQVFATDVDDEAIQTARRGAFPETIEHDVGPERLARFFTKTDGTYHVSQEVRDKVVFATQNLLTDAPFSRLDLIACRNVLIYLQSSIQRKVLRVFHYALQPQGCLLLGNSESVADSADLFGILDKKEKIYTRKSVASSLGLMPPSAVPERPAQAPPSAHAKPAPTLEQLADRTVLESYGPAGVVLNMSNDVVQFRGWTGQYLEPPPGAATFSVLKLARPEIALELHPALSKSLKDDAPVTVPGVRVETGGNVRAVTIKVVPIRGAADRRVGTLVLFEEGAVLEARAASAPPREAPAEAEDKMRRLEHELAATKRYLQTTIEDLESANEELQSANEELQSANEELQSTNEELETSKEELQSTNEELGTVNDELQIRMRDLGESRDDLQNILRGVDVALVVVGLDLRIRRYTQQAELLFGLGPEDLGRSIAHLTKLVASPGLEKAVKDVIEHVIPKSEEVRAANDRWYEMRVQPYQTLDRAIRGAVITFEDIDVIKWRIELAHEAHSAALARVADAKQPVFILNRHLRTLWANDAVYARLGLEKKDVIGHLFKDVARDHFDVESALPALELVVHEGSPSKEVALRDGGSRRFTLTARRFPGERSLGPRIEVTIREEGTLSP